MLLELRVGASKALVSGARLGERARDMVGALTGACEGDFRKSAVHFCTWLTFVRCLGTALSRTTDREFTELDVFATSGTFPDPAPLVTALN